MTEQTAIQKARSKYDAENTKRVTFKINTRTEADILQWLESQSNKQGAVKAAIRKAIAEEKAGGIS